MNEEEKMQERLRIGQRIAELRKGKHLTQKELGEVSGLPHSHISRIEAGIYSARFDSLNAIGEAVGYRLDYVKKKKGRG